MRKRSSELVCSEGRLREVDARAEEGREEGERERKERSGRQERERVCIYLIIYS